MGSWHIQDAKFLFWSRAYGFDAVNEQFCEKLSAFQFPEKNMLLVWNADLMIPEKASITCSSLFVCLLLVCWLTNSFPDVFIPLSFICTCTFWNALFKKRSPTFFFKCGLNPFTHIHKVSNVTWIKRLTERSQKIKNRKALKPNQVTSLRWNKCIRMWQRKSCDPLGNASLLTSFQMKTDVNVSTNLMSLKDKLRFVCLFAKVLWTVRWFKHRPKMQHDLSCLSRNSFERVSSQ